MTAPESDGIIWHTSSYSAGHGDCVEVVSTPERVLVRDSKDPDGPRAGLPHLGLADVPHHLHPLTTARPR